MVQDGSLDVAAMRAAAAALLGEHDFRHFCKARTTGRPLGACTLLGLRAACMRLWWCAGLMLCGVACSP